MLCLQRAELGEHRFRTLMLEIMQLLLQPIGRHDPAGFGSELPHRADILSSMRKIKDAQRFRAMVINEAL